MSRRTTVLNVWPNETSVFKLDRSSLRDTQLRGLRGQETLERPGRLVLF